MEEDYIYGTYGYFTSKEKSITKEDAIICYIERMLKMPAGMSQVDRGAIKTSLKSLQPDLAVMVGLLTLFILVFSLVGVSVGAAFWSALNGVAVGALTGIGFGVAFSIRTYLPYWRAPRPPRLGAVLRWSAEEMVIRQRARLEARGYQDGELTEVKQVGDLRVIEGGRS